jgi:hypothetical protein
MLNDEDEDDDECGGERVAKRRYVTTILEVLPSSRRETPSCG